MVGVCRACGQCNVNVGGGVVGLRWGMSFLAGRFGVGYSEQEMDVV